MKRLVPGHRPQRLIYVFILAYLDLDQSAGHDGALPGQPSVRTRIRREVDSPRPGPQQEQEDRQHCHKATPGRMGPTVQQL